MLAFGAVAGTRATSVAAAPLGGPVIIGGDDLTDHGCIDEAGNPVEGWLYLQKALENISPQVTRGDHDGSVAALGSSPTDGVFCGDAGSAIAVAAAKAGLPVTFHDNEEGIREFFAALDAGTIKPKIIWISGDGAGNDLGDGEGDEPAALADNATKLGDFVNSGGGLMSHGTEYGWLFGLLPGLTSIDDGGSDDLELTSEGNAAFPGLTNEDVNAGPWHNFFEGDFGGLQVLVKSNAVDDSQGNDAAVIIGGAAVTLPGSIVLDPPAATNPVGTNHTVTATTRDEQGGLLSGALVTFTVVAGPNAGKTGSGTTDESGQTSFTYLGDGGAGTDTIEASFVDATETTRTATATKTWQTDTPPPTSPPPSSPPAPAPAPEPAPAPSPADVNVAVSRDPGGDVAAGTNVSYLLTITNNGPGVARNVSVTNEAPAGSTFVSIAADHSTCTSGTTATCSLGTLVVGEQAHVTHVVRVDQTGPASSRASVSASEPDPTPANNTATAAMTVVAPRQPTGGQAVPPPVFGQSVNAVFTGTVLVNGVRVTDPSQIPLGAIIDVTNGRITITVATAAGGTETLTAYQGKFTIAQLVEESKLKRSTSSAAATVSITELRLVGGDFGQCGTLAKAKPKKKKKAKAKTRRTAAAAADPAKPVRRLWGSGKGKFRTKGRYSSATVRGTIWLTQDQCNGTLTRVTQGSVTVNDFVKKRQVVVRAGKSYLALAGR
ncbi:MAG: hypothetical protein ACRDNX_09300 [Gaiellaceae bacterium]